MQQQIPGGALPGMQKQKKENFVSLTIGASGIRWINLVIFIVATLKANGRMTSSDGLV